MGLSDSSEKKKAKNMVAGIVVGILVLSSVIIGGVFLFGNRKIKNVKSSEKYKVQEYTFYKAEPKNLPIGTSWIAGVYSNEYDSKYHSLYIGQLITLFGEADYTTDSNENLTSYTIGAEDKDGNVIYLEAYYGPSGPAIGGVSSDVNVKEAASELIDLIRSAAPTDYRLTSIYEDFPAIVIMGVKNGEPYYNSRMGISWFPRRIILMLDLLFQR